jgi:hypothetical protein
MDKEVTQEIQGIVGPKDIQEFLVTKGMKEKQYMVYQGRMAKTETQELTVNQGNEEEQVYLVIRDTLAKEEI